MERVFIRGTRAAAAVALLAALAAVPARAADWDALEGSGWSSGESDAEGMATSTANPAAGGGGAGAEIASAFQDLGMASAQAECFGNVLSGQLSAGEQQEAAELVRTASSGDEVRRNVLNAGPNVVGAFTAANERCR